EYMKTGTLAREICHRNGEGGCAGDQCPCSRKYWKARCTAASGRTWRGYRISSCVNRSSWADPRPPERLRRRTRVPGDIAQTAYTGVKPPVPSIVGPEPLHPELATRGAFDLEKADLEHDLLRRSHRHRVHDSAAFGYHTLVHLTGAPGGDRIGGDAAEHDLAVAAANADTAAAGARTDLFLEIAGVQGDLHVDHADQLHALIEYRDVGGPNLLALNIQCAI